MSGAFPLDLIHAIDRRIHECDFYTPPPTGSDALRSDKIERLFTHRLIQSIAFLTNLQRHFRNMDIKI